MIYQQTLARARPVFRTVNNPHFVGVVTDLINITTPLERDGDARPQAILVEQSANWTLPTHFHLQHQFQIFVAGGGTIGKHPIDALSVHYATPHTGYGPLISGDQGIAYFTLRARSDIGAWYLPESRPHLKIQLPKQQAHGASVTPTVVLSTLTVASEEVVITPQAGGLAAWLMRVPPQQTVTPPVHAQGGGRFYVVTQGAMRLGGETLPLLSTVFVTADDGIAIVASDAGLDVLVLQFPAAALVAVAD